MKKLPNSIPALPHRFLAPNDTSLFAFVGALRLAVRAKVKDEQRLGVSFAEIVIHVREMVRDSEETAGHSSDHVSPTFRSISRQAVRWCLEAYRPAPGQRELPGDRFPVESPT
ncbi:MAG TPA: hypothetical protein VK648_10595 [Gemmatimonadaceae bacterium]|nr:hypothetical protein [Gemmatimonadaceae bacterium]